MVGARGRAQQPVRHDAALPDHGLRPRTYSAHGTGVRGRWGRGQQPIRHDAAIPGVSGVKARGRWGKGQGSVG